MTFILIVAALCFNCGFGSSCCSSLIYLSIRSTYIDIGYVIYAIKRIKGRSQRDLSPEYKSVTFEMKNTP
jgi:hypothetical protein